MCDPHSTCLGATTYRYATKREIRAYLGNGSEGMVVRVGRDGQVLYRCVEGRDRDGWINGGHADSYRVSSDGDVYYATIFCV